MSAARETESASSHVDAPSGRDGSRKAPTWSFRALVRLKHGQTFSDLLDARKPQMDTALPSETVISWACTNTARIQSQDPNGGHFEGFVHASTHIRLGSLSRVLPEKQTTDAGDIVDVTFEEVNPGPGRDYMSHSTIKTFLEETSLDPHVSDKRKRVDYRGSSANVSEIIQAKTWFGCGTFLCSTTKQVEAVFKSADVVNRQKATLGSAEVITYACAGPRGQEFTASSSSTV